MDKNQCPLKPDVCGNNFNINKKGERFTLFKMTKLIERIVRQLYILHDRILV